MCIIIAKYFKDLGWVLAKNRDQNYVSTLSFDDEKVDNVGEILVMHDKDTDYKEGMNHAGLTIITTSLAPNFDDETDEEDGKRIYKALHMTKPEDAAEYFINEQMTGHIFIATPQKLVIIEAGKTENGKGKYHSKMRIIPRTEVVVRTNHGIEFPWAGFQYGFSEKQDMWRKSSEMRKMYAEKIAKVAKSPIEILEGLATKFNDDLQMNIFRVEKERGQMRTIFQWALTPSRGVAIIRPVQVKMKLKVSNDKLQVEVLDNENIKKTFDGKVKHFSKIITDKTDTRIMTRTEQYLGFKTYLEYR